MLEACDLGVSYGRMPVLNGVSAALGGGHLTALIGPNGSGKSTLLRALAGLLPATGTVHLNGRPATPAVRREAIAYMPQDLSAASSLTLVEVVLLGRLRSLGMRVPDALIDGAQESLDRFGIRALADRSLDAVSGGQRQLAFLAQALFRQPRVLLLDEPTAALDLRHQLLVLETVRALAEARGIAVVIAIHDLSLAARFADAFVCLHGGEVVSKGSVSDVLTPQRLAEIYGVEAEVVRGGDGRLRITLLGALGSGAPVEAATR